MKSFKLSASLSKQYTPQEQLPTFQFKMNINIDIPDDTHTLAKMKAASKKITLKEYFIKAVEKRNLLK